MYLFVAVVVVAIVHVCMCLCVASCYVFVCSSNTWPGYSKKSLFPTDFFIYLIDTGM